MILCIFSSIEMIAVIYQQSVMLRWLFVVYQSCNEVPFHNFKHVFMVTQMVCIMICSVT